MTRDSWLRRIRRPVFAWALTALLLEFVAEWALERGTGLPRPAQIALALAPLFPSLLFMYALVRMLQRMDELQKHICLESVFFAFMCTLVLTFVLAGLEQAGVYQPRGEMIGTSMMALWACGYIYSSWKYR